MQTGTDPWQAAGFLGMTVQTLIGRYGHHHHPDYLSGARGAFSRHRNRQRGARLGWRAGRPPRDTG
jgi:hypothetical protein